MHVSQRTCGPPEPPDGPSSVTRLSSFAQTPRRSRNQLLKLRLAVKRAYSSTMLATLPSLGVHGKTSNDC